MVFGTHSYFTPRAESDFPTEQRFDRQVESDLAHRLQHSGYAVLADITCHCRDGVLALSGTVPTYYLKQVAQEIALRLENVNQVENRIRVDAEPDHRYR